MPPTDHHARPNLRVCVALFLTFSLSYAYFWQPRDWNVASRLMLSFALVDQHSVSVDGYEEQAGHRAVTGEMVAGDLAYFDSRYYTEKAPGQSLIGAIFYALFRHVGGLEPHPQYIPALAYFWGDYLCTIATSGLLTSATAVLLYCVAVRLGASHHRGALVAWSYALATPAFLYGTLFYGHQSTAFCALAAFYLVFRSIADDRVNVWHMALAGLLSGLAMVIEYPSCGYSVAIGVYVLCAARRPKPVLQFVIGVCLGFSLLLAYNYKAFGHPLELGYEHLITDQFKEMHSEANPYAVRLPDRETLKEVIDSITISQYRGILWYGPASAICVLGVIALVCKKQWGAAFVALAACGWTMAVNALYPAWWGGWCTGPRLLVPGLPFAFVAVAGLLAADPTRLTSWATGLCCVWGTAIMTACVAIGGRLPAAEPNHYRELGVATFEHDSDLIAHAAQDAIDKLPSSEPLQRRSDRISEIVFAREMLLNSVLRADYDTMLRRQLNPMYGLVLPRWKGDYNRNDTTIADGQQFVRNAGQLIVMKWLPPELLPPGPSLYHGIQFAPLIVWWAIMLCVLIMCCRRAPRKTPLKSETTPAPSSS